MYYGSLSCNLSSVPCGFQCLFQPAVVEPQQQQPVRSIGGSASSLACLADNAALRVPKGASGFGVWELCLGSDGQGRDLGLLFSDDYSPVSIHLSSSTQ